MIKDIAGGRGSGNASQRPGGAWGRLQRPAGSRAGTRRAHQQARNQGKHQQRKQAKPGSIPHREAPSSEPARKTARRRPWLDDARRKAGTPGTADTLRPSRRDAHPADRLSMPPVSSARAERQGPAWLADSARNRLLYRYAIRLYHHAADTGEGEAAWQLADLLADRGDPDGLCARADAGDRGVIQRLADLLAERGDLDVALRLAELLETAAARAGCARSSRTSGAPAPGWPGCWAVAATWTGRADPAGPGRRRRRERRPGDVSTVRGGNPEPGLRPWWCGLAAEEGERWPPNLASATCPPARLSTARPGARNWISVQPPWPCLRQ